MFKWKTTATRKSSLPRQVQVVMETASVLVCGQAPPFACVSLCTLNCLRAGAVSFVHSFVRSFRKGLQSIFSVLCTVQSTKDANQTWSLGSENLQHRKGSIIQHSARHGGLLVFTE